ncbi:hypothetical protein Tco_1112773 [Tanacetum coccineum]|uniref:Uncharacterized protein n=1 Tax=Tanacetum coccineum TaxID=301880 RepID=A0ABQ5IRR9_9ASTR
MLAWWCSPKDLMIPIDVTVLPLIRCGDPLEDGIRCQQCTCKWCGYNLKGGFCLFCTSRNGNSSIDAPNLISFNDPPNVFTHPPQPQNESYSCELCRKDAHYGYDCPPRESLSIQEDLNQQRMNDILKVVQSLVEKLCQQEQATNLSTHTPEPSRHFDSICYDDDDDEESTIPLNEIISQIPPSIAIILVLPTMEPEDSLIMGDENLSTIPEKESDEFIKSSVEDLVPIPSESEDTSDNDSECDLPFCDDSFPLDILGGNYVTFSNPLFDANDDFTSSDDESLPEEDVPKENFKIYSNPLFEFDDEYISSDVNSLFNELNEDECFDPGGDFVLEEIEVCLTSDSIPPGIDDDDFDPEGDILLLEKLLNDDPSSPPPPKELNFEELKVIKSDVSTNFEDDYYDSEGDIIYLKSLLIKDTIPNLPPKVFLDHDLRSLEDEPDKDDLKNIVKVFDPGIWEIFFSPTYVKLPFEDRYYLSLTYVIRIFLPYFTYPVDSSLPLSSGSEDTIFDPGISAFHFSSLKPVDCSDYEDSRARDNGYSVKGQKQRQSGQNRARDWKEREKTEPRAYSSLMGQPATLAIPCSPIGWTNMETIQGLKDIDLKIKGLDECFKDAPPHGLEPSAYHYK